MAGNPKSNKWEAEGIAALEWKGIEARVRSLVGFEVLKSSGYLGSNKWEAPTVSALENRSKPASTRGMLTAHRGHTTH
jgi:hypothetical protein